MAANAPEDLPHVIVRIALNRNAAQTDRAKPVLQVVADFRQQASGGGEREIIAAKAEHRKAGPLHLRKCCVDLLALLIVQRADPGARLIQLLAVPASRFS